MTHDKIELVEQTMWSATCTVCGWESEWCHSPAQARQSADSHRTEHGAPHGLADDYTTSDDNWRTIRCECGWETRPHDTRFHETAAEEFLDHIKSTFTTSQEDDVDHCTPDRHVTPHKGCILR